MRRTKDLSTAGTGGVNWPRMTLIVLIALPAVAVLLPTTLVIFVLSLPTIAAFLIDRTKERYLVATVGLLNFCGLLPAVIALWDQGQSLAGALRVLSDMVFWLSAFGAAALGWGIFISIPPIIATYYAVVTQRRISQLARRQKQLIEAWGEEVVGLRRADEEDEPGSALDQEEGAAAAG